MSLSRYEQIYEVVRQIPAGKVATYGQVADLAGLEGHARQVGYALHALPEKNDVPWHRVINARGEVSARTAGDSHELQRLLLEGEGVVFRSERVSLERCRWEPQAARSPAPGASGRRAPEPRSSRTSPR